MLNIKTISRILENGDREEKVIYELAKEDNFKYFLLGQSIGVSMNHCVALGMSHKDNFWHRVYGYMIVLDNTKQENMLLTAMRKIKPEVESYITVRFYERRANHKLMFVPKRLNIPERPELNNFPYNIAFATNRLDDRNQETQETAVYDPDSTTFTEDGTNQKMKYYNKLNPEKRFWVEIIYDTKRQSYFGTKYDGDKSIGSASGPKWDGFFIHLTLLGVASGLD